MTAATSTTAETLTVAETGSSKMRKLMMVLMIAGAASPAWSYDKRDEAAQRISRELAMVDAAHRKCGISASDRRAVWDAAEAASDIVGMDWERIRRNAKSNAGIRVDCDRVHFLVNDAQYFNNLK